MWIIIVSSTIYFLSLIFFLLGLKKTKLTKSITSPIIDVSVILCVRNGQDSLPNILNDFIVQDYGGNIEFIVVDDYSIDETKNIILEFVEKDNRFKYIHSKSNQSSLSHKKRALKAGIDASKFDWLLFTDVDCRVGNKWVSGMASNYNQNDYILGFSMTSPSNSLVSKFQNIDYNMLMFTACS